jgi:hypothetical protein|tara:strand:+ start:769 stop:909 length:141 start_codon:yes stop_codon:yes gene_type:complete
MKWYIVSLQYRDTMRIWAKDAERAFCIITQYYGVVEELIVKITLDD